MAITKAGPATQGEREERKLQRLLKKRQQREEGRLAVKLVDATAEPPEAAGWRLPRPDVVLTIMANGEIAHVWQEQEGYWHILGIHPTETLDSELSVTKRPMGPLGVAEMLKYEGFAPKTARLTMHKLLPLCRELRRYVLDERTFPELAEALGKLSWPDDDDISAGAALALFGLPQTRQDGLAGPARMNL
jgi:hypothetical protein